MALVNVIVNVDEPLPPTQFTLESVDTESIVKPDTDQAPILAPLLVALTSVVNLTTIWLVNVEFPARTPVLDVVAKSGVRAYASWIM